MLILQWYKGQRGKAKKPITQQLVMNVKQVSSCQSYGEIEKLNKKCWHPLSWHCIFNKENTCNGIYSTDQVHYLETDNCSKSYIIISRYTVSKELFWKSKNETFVLIWQEKLRVQHYCFSCNSTSEFKLAAVRTKYTSSRSTFE